MRRNTYAIFANGLTAKISKKVKVGQTVRAFQRSYFDKKVKCYFTSTVIGKTDYVYPTAILTTRPESEIFE